MGRSWALLGRSRVLLGRSRALLGRSRGGLGRLTESALGRLEVALSSLGIYYYEVIRLGRETLAFRG